jgi:hypothetical protein
MDGVETRTVPDVWLELEVALPMFCAAAGVLECVARLAVHEVKVRTGPETSFAVAVAPSLPRKTAGVLGCVARSAVHPTAASCIGSVASFLLSWFCFDWVILSRLGLRGLSGVKWRSRCRVEIEV